MMIADNYFDITSLPVLEEPPSAPPLTPAQLTEHLADSRVSCKLVEVLFLLDDILQREAFLAGETDQVNPTVLTPGQVRNEEPLPEYLVFDADRVSRAVEVDYLWEAYFRYAAEIAERYGSRYLAAWVGYEVALRNVLTMERAKRLGLEADDYTVANDLSDTQEDFSSVVGEWSSAQTPLAGYRVLILARWAWIGKHDAWFTFKNDELVAYANRLMLLYQWHRLDEAKTKNPLTENADKTQESFERASR